MADTPPPPPLPPGSSTSNRDLYPVLFHIYERLGHIDTSITTHERRDDERHFDTSKRLELLERASRDLEKADITGSHNLSELQKHLGDRKEKAKVYREWVARAVLLIFGAALAVLGGGIARALAMK